MSQKELTPAEFTFHSFRHSQGSIMPQLYIFRYFQLHFGIEPDLHPSANDRRRYLQYVGATSLKTHIQYKDEGAQSADGTIIASFKSLRRYANKPSTVRHVNKFKEPNISRALVSSVLRQEMNILGAEKPWAALENNQDFGHTERLKHRIASGKGSFVLHYGNDGHTTGIPQFDQMYADMWKATERHEGRDNALAKLITNHAFALESAKRLFIEPEADQHLSA